MSGNDEVTTGELGRRMDSLAGAVERGLAGLTAELKNYPDWKDVQRVEAGTIERHGVLVARVAQLEDGRQWLSRQIGAALITGGAGLVVAAVATVKAGIL